MARTASRARRLIAAALAVSAIVPASAHATHVALFGPSTRFGFRAEIQITGTRAPDRIRIGYIPAESTFVVTDPAGITVAGCESFSRTRARCTAPANSRIDVNAGRGGDRIRVAAIVPTGVSVSGGSGDDLITGGRGDDQLIGDGGDDVLRGKRGDDSLGALFDTGRDAFFGGAGNDDIDASERGSRPDRRIDCGSGKRDDAFVDRHRDPRPTGCEDVFNT